MNACSSILVILFGKVILVNDEQPQKAPSPILFTPTGIVISVKDLHPEKALSPILVTPLGIVILVKEDAWYLQPVITQYFASNKSEIWS